MAEKGFKGKPAATLISDVEGYSHFNQIKII